MPKSKLIKQQEAQQRQVVRNKRSTSDQINVLDGIFGKGLGAIKERTKLNNTLNKRTQPVEETEDADKPKKKKTRSKKIKE